MKNPVYFSAQKTAWLYLNLFSCLFISFAALNKSAIIISVVISVVTVSLGHSIGLHRGIIHQAYSTSKGFRNFLLILFIFTGMRSPLTWIKLHYTRDFWQNKTSCHPYLGYQHSIWKDFIWYLHYSFTVDQKDLEEYGFPKEFYKDQFLKFLDKTWYLFSIIPAILVWIFWGFQEFLIIFPVRISINLLMHWFIGYISHKHGYRKYIIANANESGYNHWLLGVISFGEGFHNNHHAFPSSSRFGVRWFEFDLSWQFIKVLRFSKLIWNVKSANHETLKPTAIELEKMEWN